MKRLLLLSTFIFSYLSSAGVIHGEHFVRIKQKSVLKEFANYQHFFNNIYWVKADRKQLKKLENKNSLSYFAPNTKSEKSSLYIKRTPFVGETQHNLQRDPLLRSQYSHSSSYWGGMDVKSYWSKHENKQRKEVIVAVVDTGVDHTHEDLRNQMWVNTKEIAGNGVDDDNNGYIDDIHGINTLIRDSAGNATMDTSDADGHGSHVSGIIAAERNNGIGIAGIAQKAKIMALRTVPSQGDETDRDVAEAFLYAARNGAKIINCSFGKRVNEEGMLVKETIDFIGQEFGVLVVAAAGNASTDIDTKKRYPASFESENLFVIGASTKKKKKAYFSNYGFVGVDVAAPGDEILSSMPGDRYEYMSGTSMASPNAAGAAAELMSTRPNLTAIDVKNILMETANIREDAGDGFWFATTGWINLLEAAK